MLFPRYMNIAHSFRGTSASVAYSSGVSIKEIMNAANWSSSKTFFKFYYKEVNIHDVAGCDTDGLSRQPS